MAQQLIKLILDRIQKVIARQVLELRVATLIEVEQLAVVILVNSNRETY